MVLSWVVWRLFASILTFRDGPLKNLWQGGEGGGGGQSTKKNIRARENCMKTNSCTPINPKKYSCYGLKNIHTRNLITIKNSCGSKIPLSPPPPPITFLMVRPLVSAMKLLFLTPTSDIQNYLPNLPLFGPHCAVLNGARVFPAVFYISL